ncbi:thermonuclease family protein [Acidimangrovimonas sediminis]|uniref:thermonuclease family protein n=1 Tax=Acidimangrovimonas sediminis TaxID=2056283 RepID=UPI0018EAA2C9|nr:thermonuclease family protein [Acidimangrovimonas sediminis]
MLRKVPTGKPMAGKWMAWKRMAGKRMAGAMLRAALILLAFASPAVALPICGSGYRVNCVVDGDTVWLRREKIRLADIDAPELQARCHQERVGALKAQARLAVLLTGKVTIKRHGKGYYGRTLATLYAHGRDVNAEMVREGLARPYGGHRRPWCG